MYEALTRYLNSIPGENPEEVKVVKVAPTGKAAFNINGNTLVQAFCNQTCYLLQQTLSRRKPVRNNLYINILKVSIDSSVGKPPNTINV